MAEPKYDAVEARILEHLTGERRQADRAIDAFIEGYGTYFKHFISGKLGPGGPGDPSADELMQDFYVQVWKGFRTAFRGDSSVKTWAATIAAHMVRDFIRRRVKERERIAQRGSYIDELRDHALATPGPGVITELARALPADEAELLALKARENMTDEEIAQHLGITVHQVKYALKKLRARSARVLDSLELLTR